MDFLSHNGPADPDEAGVTADTTGLRLAPAGITTIV
jgi:hypothetical protein